MIIKRTLPALLGVMLAAGAGSVIADVSVVGHIDTSVDGIDKDGGEDDVTLGCTTCSIGFKGSEDLGNGLNAIFFLDWEYDTTERNKSITDRDQWVGLSGGFGQLRIGTISTGYKSHGAMLDPLYRTALQGRDQGLQSGLHSNAGEEGEGRATNTFRWDSADFNGVKLVAHYTLDGSEADGEDNNPFGVGASYQNGDLLAFADYLTNDGNGDATQTELEAWKVGGKYGMGMFSFMGQYEDISKSSTSSDDETVWYLAAGVNGLLGMNIYLGYGQGEDDTSGDDYAAWTLAISHDMSKNTMVYLGHSQYDCDSGDPDGAGPQSATLSVCGDIGPAGGESDQTSIGIKHKF